MTNTNNEVFMGDLVLIHSAKDEKDRADREILVSGIEQLLEQAKCGDLKAVSFVGIPVDGVGLRVGLLKTPGCAVHELVGASVMLSDYLRKKLGAD